MFWDNGEVAENMLFYKANTAITAPFTLAEYTFPFTMGGGLVAPADPSVAAPVILCARGYISLQQREELTTVLVQVVTDCLWTFRARLGTHTVAADVITWHDTQFFPVGGGRITVITVVKAVNNVSKRINNYCLTLCCRVQRQERGCRHPACWECPFWACPTFHLVLGKCWWDWWGQAERWREVAEVTKIMLRGNSTRPFLASQKKLKKNKNHAPFILLQEKGTF